MKRSISWASLAAMAWLATTGAGGQTPIPPNPQIEIAYVKPPSAELTPIYEQMKGRKVLETMQQFLAPLKLPAGKKLTVHFDQCSPKQYADGQGPFTKPYVQGQPVTICYEYIAQIEKVAPSARVNLAQGPVTPAAAVVGPVVQAVFREIAVAVFDVMDIPVWGRIDDSADRLAAFLMLQFPDVAWNAIIGTAWFMSSNAVDTPDFSDVRGTVAQRYYTTLCIAFGGEVDRAVRPAENTTFYSFVGELRGGLAAGDLPWSRAQSCPTEYARIQEAFNTFILPRVDKPLLKQVQETAWANILFGPQR